MTRVTSIIVLKFHLCLQKFKIMTSKNERCPCHVSGAQEKRTTRTYPFFLFFCFFLSVCSFSPVSSMVAFYRPYFCRSSDCHCLLRSGKVGGILMLLKSLMHCFISSSALGLSAALLRPRPLLPRPSLSPTLPTPLLSDWKSSLLRRLSWRSSLGSSIHCTDEPFLGGRPSVSVLGGRETECRAPQGAAGEPPTLTTWATIGRPSWGDVASECVSELEVESSLSEAPLSLPLSGILSDFGSSPFSCLGDETDFMEGPVQKHANNKQTNTQTNLMLN